MKSVLFIVLVGFIVGNILQDFTLTYEKSYFLMGLWFLVLAVLSIDE